MGMSSRQAHFDDVPFHDNLEQKALAEAKENKERRHRRWTLGILADNKTAEVPGTVLLLSRFSAKNIPLGLQHDQARGRSLSKGSIPGEADRREVFDHKIIDAKKTANGQIILEPQPDDSPNDPLNWQKWRRDAALLSLGYYCMLGGGMTPVLAAGFNQVANDLNVSYAYVARTTGLYMMGLGIGCVIVSPTAIIFGKRPVYLICATLFVLTSAWCALSPNYAHLVTARVFQGISVSCVEALPSATIAEIFFLHERAFRIGIYGLLLLGGKNLVPLVSAFIIQALSWRWVFWIVAVLVGIGGVLLFMFVPETFWDRTPRPRALGRRSTSMVALRQSRTNSAHAVPRGACAPLQSPQREWSESRGLSVVRSETVQSAEIGHVPRTASEPIHKDRISGTGTGLDGAARAKPKMRLNLPPVLLAASAPASAVGQSREDDPNLPTLHNLNSPYYAQLEKSSNYLDFQAGKEEAHFAPQDLSIPAALGNTEKRETAKHAKPSQEPQRSEPMRAQTRGSPIAAQSSQVPITPVISPQSAQLRKQSELSFTTGLRDGPPRPWVETLKPWNGRLNQTSWWRAAIRPGILFAYPSVLWATLVYSLSIGWLIVLSESVSHIYSNRESYNFNSLQIGLVYLSPFVGGVLGTVVAGKVSDIIVRYMARRNNGIYEPEYRLVMAVPITVSTVVGLMGFGWSAEERDAWIIPTLFFGIISFGCSLGSTTAITFCVDSYRQYAGEALVTLNFSKNVFHGLVWSLFFPQWLEADGAKKVFVAIGGIQLACMLLSIPMYVFGKRARMWTVRKGMMEGF